MEETNNDIHYEIGKLKSRLGMIKTHVNRGYEVAECDINQAIESLENVASIAARRIKSF